MALCSVAYGGTRAPGHALTPGPWGELKPRFEAAHPGDVLGWALEESGLNPIAIASSFQSEGTVVMRLTTGIRRDVPVLFLDTRSQFLGDSSAEGLVLFRGPSIRYLHPYASSTRRVFASMSERGLTLPPLRHRLVRGSLWVGGMRALSAAAGLATMALLARLLSPAELGVYFLAITMINLGAVVAQLGLRDAVVRVVAESVARGQPGRARAAIRLTITIGSLSAVVVALALMLEPGQWLARTAFGSPLLGSVLALVAVSAILMTLRTLVAESFRGLQDLRSASLFRDFTSSGLLAVLLAGAWVMWRETNIQVVLQLVVVASASTLLLASWVLGRRVRSLGPMTGLAARPLIAISIPLWVTALAASTLTQADVAILGIAASQTEVAIYGAAARFVTVLLIPLGIVNAVIAPIIAELHTQARREELERVLRTSATVAGVPLLVGILFLTFFGESVLSVVYGGFYRQGSGVLAILAIGLAVNVSAGSCAITLMMTGHQMTLLKITLLSATITVLSAALLARFGALGVAAAAAGGMAFYNVAMVAMTRMRVGVWTPIHPSPTTMRLAVHAIRQVVSRERSGR